MAYEKTERTHQLEADLLQNMWLLEDEYKSNPTEDTLRLLDIAKDFLQIYQMTLDSLDEVENNEKTVRIS